MMNNTTNVRHPTQPVVPALIPPVSGFSRLFVTANADGTDGEGATGVPHDGQNFASAVNAAPQFEQ
jgi:hypothetical protein